MNDRDMIGYDDLLSITPFFNLRTKNAYERFRSCD